MKTQDAIRYFGSAAQLAKALGISTQAVTQWGEDIPQRRQYEIERLSGGRLRAETSADMASEATAVRRESERQGGEASTQVPDDVLSRMTQLSALVAQLALLVDDIERISNASAAASLRAQYHQTMADLLACTQQLERPGDPRTENLRQRHVERAVEYQRALERMGGG